MRRDASATRDAQLAEPVMSLDTLACVNVFYCKADDLCHKGHLLRAAENFSRAADAARASLGADNLVTLQMLLQKSNMLGGFAAAASKAATADPRILAAHRAECIALLSGAVEALERRRVAGTLLEGKCSAVEEAWRASDVQRVSPNCTAASTASIAALIGYEKFIHAGTLASDVLACAQRFAAECSAARFLSFAQCAVHAAELMQ